MYKQTTCWFSSCHVNNRPCRFVHVIRSFKSGSRGNAERSCLVSLNSTLVTHSLTFLCSPGFRRGCPYWTIRAQYLHVGHVHATMLRRGHLQRLIRLAAFKVSCVLLLFQKAFIGFQFNWSLVASLPGAQMPGLSSLTAHQSSSPKVLNTLSYAGKWYKMLYWDSPRSSFDNRAASLVWSSCVTCKVLRLINQAVRCVWRSRVGCSDHSIQSRISSFVSGSLVRRNGMARPPRLLPARTAHNASYSEDTRV